MRANPFLAPIRAARQITLVLALLLAGCAQLSLAEEIAQLMKEAIALLQGKRYDEAISKFTSVVQTDAKHWPAYVGMARAHLGKGNWVSAITNGREAYKLAPQGSDVLPTLAESLLGGGLDAVRGSRWNDAIGYLGDYLKLQPNDASAYLNIGRAFLGSRQYAPALDAFVKGLSAPSAGAQRNDLLRGIYDGGMQAYQANDFGGAIGFLSEYVKNDRGNFDAYLNLAKSYWNAGDRVQALNSFRDVLRLNPTNTEALRFMLQR